MAGDAVIVAGFECRGQATPASLQAAFECVRAQVPAIAALAAPSDRAELLTALARLLLPRHIGPDRLATCAVATGEDP